MHLPYPRNPALQPGRWIAIVIAIISVFALPGLVLAHPLGDFAISRYSRLALDVDHIRLLYVVDMAEIPTFQERPFIDADDDDTLSPEELESYLTRQVAELQANLNLEVDGVPASLSLQEQSLEFVPGDGGLDTMRISASFVAPLTSQEVAWQIDYHDANFADRVGWQEVVVQANSDVVLLESTAPTEDLSQELRNYPEDIQQLTTSSATFRFEPKALSGGTKTSITVPARTRKTDQSLMAGEDTEFSALINSSLSTPSAVLVVLLAAFGWGAAHAFTPGHGKTIVAAYLVGSRGTVTHALFLGLTTTLTHTAGVFVVGFLTLFASAYILPEQLYPWLAVASGILVITIGLSILRGRVAGFRGGKATHHHHHHGDHDPDHSQPHHHEHDHPHPHHHDHSPSDHHHHHDHGDGHGHSHLPPGSDGTPITWRSLLALGISGGLIPCPSALLVMLSAIALERVGFGLVLIVVFSLGLAGVLTGVGIVWVKAAELLNRLSSRGGVFSNLPGGGGRLFEALPVLSALFITIVGVGLTYQALIQTGVLGS
jgi:nickel/cobalt exporter